MYLLESHNQCPDCLSVDLKLIPTGDNHDEYELYFSYQAHEQIEHILDGKVKFSLRIAKLFINFDSLEILEINKINESFIELIENDLSTQKYWLIKPNLSQNAKEIKLATFKVLGGKSRLRGRVLADKSYLELKEIEGLWHHNITPNKHAILERKVAEFIANRYFQPYGIQIIFTNDKLEEIPKINNQSNQEFAQELNNLKNIITTVYQNPQDDFQTLAKIANLNPLKDFMGANLIGVNLSNLNLSSCNLQDANLRGADLTDVDLSEANLQNVKLNGADLSGAYLEGANLTNANLTNASLALGNLIGANLTNANLTNTNLQDTSLGQAVVKGAIFANNLGLTAEKRQELISKDAIF